MRGWGVKEGGGDLSARYYREFSLCKRRFSVWVLIWNNLGAAEIFWRRITKSSFVACKVIDRIELEYNVKYRDINLLLDTSNNWRAIFS